MKKKKTIFTYIKRTILFAILGIIVLCLGIFFLGKYKASSSEFNNKYTNEFWDTLPDFVHSDQIYQDIYAQDCTKRAEGSYIPPYSEDASLEERIDSARYVEELNDIWTVIQDTLAYRNLNASGRAKIKKYFENALASNKLPSWSEYIIPQNEKEVLNNGNYRLIFNYADTTFKLENLKTGEILRSNPTNPDSALGILKSQMSLLNVVYVSGDKSETPVPAMYTTYENSTNENTQEKIKPDYYVKYDEANQTLIVYYVFKVGGVDYTYFPEVISNARLDEICNRSVEKVEEAIANGEVLTDSTGAVITGMFLNGSKIGVVNKNSFTQADFEKTSSFWNRIFATIYKEDLDSTGGYYCRKCYTSYTQMPAGEKCTKHDCDGEGSSNFAELVNYRIGSGAGSTPYAFMGKTDIKDLYRFFYEWCDYTLEDLKIDTGADKASSSSPVIKCAIEYSLGENGLQVMVPGNSLRASANEKGQAYRVVSIDVLPYFTSVKQNTEQGYFVIPDGSGAIMNFDNGKYDYSAYSKRVYTTDLAFTSYTLNSSTTDLLLPMYALSYTKANKALIVEGTQGASQMILNAGVSGQSNGNNTFNYAYFSIVVRESEQVIFGTSTYNRVRIRQYTQKAATGDYKINYSHVDSSKYSTDYSGIAKCYRDILIDRIQNDPNYLTKLNENGDVTNQIVLDLDVIGSYEYHTNFLGIGYEAKGTLTTSEQLIEMINDISGLGINSSAINVYYQGWRKEALSNASFKTIKVSGKIGGKKGFLNMISQLSQQNVNVYPQVEFIEYNKFQESFGRSHYTSRDISGSFSGKYPYELNTGVYNKKANKIFTLSPNYYYAFAKELATNYTKVLKGVNSIAITGLGSKMSGSYRKDREVFKYTAVEEQIKSLKVLTENGLTKIALDAPYLYAIPFTSNAFNVPTSTTGQEVIDYAIPFYQLVINGMMDYSGVSINEKSEDGIMKHIMKCIETGSNPSFTFTYDDSSELLQTDYNKYYYTYYERWLEDVKTVCNTLNDLGIYGAKLVAHERLANNVYKVTYQDKADSSKQIQIILNYQRMPWEDIEANSYKVLE